MKYFIVSVFISAGQCRFASNLMFAWHLFREFRDSLKIAKFNTSKLEKKNFFFFPIFF